MQKFEDHRLLHIWAQRLSHYSIAYKGMNFCRACRIEREDNVYCVHMCTLTEIFMNNASSKREILQQIINSNKENVIPLLKDYCCNFGFDFNDCLWHYLKIIIETWNPAITVSSVNKGE